MQSATGNLNAVIAANGELQSDARLRELWQRADLPIAADGGARNARLHLDRAPDVLIGDLDSLDAETRVWLAQSNVEIIQHPRDKDETDLELALNLAWARGADRVTILGAFGGRVDHFIANIVLLARVHTGSSDSRSLNLRIEDASSEVWCGNDHALIEGNIGDVVSLIPFDERVEGIVTKGLEYPLRAETLTRGSTRGISNVMVTTHAEVKWKRGLLLVVHLFSRQSKI